MRRNSYRGKWQYRCTKRCVLVSNGGQICHLLDPCHRVAAKEEHPGPMRPPDWPAPPSDSLDSEDVVSPDAATPRGGFMARPGFKRPPQHAVVVRVGDVPESEHIPVARASVPPPPPALEAPVVVPTAAPESRRSVPAPRVPSAPPRVSSMPPPSEMPVVASVPAPASFVPSRVRSRWAILLAAAAGLLLGLASVATRTRSVREPRPAAQPLRMQQVPAASVDVPAPAPAVVAEPRALDAPVAAPPASGAGPEPQPKSASSGPPPSGAPRRSIF